MPYNIVLSNGEPLVTLADAVTDNSYTSLTLFGKNFAGYGQFLNENFVHLLENFSSSVAPFNPVVGQIWYDTLNHNMKVFSTNGTWVSLSGITSKNSPPNSPNNGDCWWDLLNNQLYVWAESEWILLGPKWNSIQGKTETESFTVVDITGSGHTLLLFYIKNQVVGLWNNDSEFTVAPEDAIGNFPVTIPHGFSFDTLNVETLNVSGDQTNQGDVLILGNEEIKGNLLVWRDAEIKGNLLVGGNETIQGNLLVNGNEEIQGNLLVDGNEIVNGNLLVNGNETIQGNLTINSNEIIQGNLVVNGSLTVQSAITSPQPANLKGNFTGNFYIDPDGSETIPSLAFNAHRTTGFWYGNKDAPEAAINITHNGVNRVYIESHGMGLTGTLKATGDVLAFSTSDRNLKTNIQPIENALSKLRKITGVMFDWTDEAIEKMGGEDDYLIRKQDTGVIAQDVEAVLPEVVAQRPDGTKAVKYEKLAGLIIQAINELADEVDQLKKKQ